MGLTNPPPVAPERTDDAVELAVDRGESSARPSRFGGTGATPLSAVLTTAFDGAGGTIPESVYFGAASSEDITGFAAARSSSRIRLPISTTVLSNSAARVSDAANS